MKTELLHKYFRGETTEKEENQIVEWVESSVENKEHFLKERMLFDVTLFSDGSNIQRKPKGHLYLYPLIAIAAMLAIVFVMDLPHMHKPKQQLSQTIRIPAGQRAQMDLPDGSVVWLNSQTTLTYDEDFGKKDRKVTLDGEAYFEVTPDKDRPFVVKAADLEITVLGTAFDVCAYKDDNEVSVVLLTGKVDVASESNRYVMQPDEKLVYDRNTGTMQVGKVYSKEYVEWTDGNLRFENESLENIVKVLSRVYNVKIVFDSAFPEGQYFFTGSIGSGGITNALDILSMTSSLHYEVRDSVIVLHKK